MRRLLKRWWFLDRHGVHPCRHCGFLV